MSNVTAVQFSQEQDDILTLFKQIDYYKEYFTPVMLLMSTGAFARDKDELIQILIEYPGLNETSRVSDTIEECISKKFLCRDNGKTTIYQDNDAFERYLQSIVIDESCVADHDRLCVVVDDIKNRIRRCRETHANSKCVIDYGLLSGGTTNGASNTTFRERLKEAQQEILLPMLNTAAHTETIKILKAQDIKGVRIKILLADYEKVTKKLRSGRPDTTDAWIEALKDTNNVEIRIFSNLDDCILSSSVIVDNILRLVVVDPRREKTSNGTLIECHKHGFSLNITEIVRDRFNEIWERSRPIFPKRVSKVQMILKNKLVLAGLVAIALWSASYIGLPDELSDLMREISMMALGACLPAFISYITSKAGRFREKIRKLSET